MYIEKWLAGEVDGGNDNWGGVSKHIRRYLRIKYNNSCCLCGWNKVNPYTNKIPLEIDHIDGDPLNHSESNLRLICPNCHSLTETYRGHNKKNGIIKGRGYKVTPTERTKRSSVKNITKLSEINCEFCGTLFKPRNRKQRFCCVSCGQKNRYSSI